MHGEEELAAGFVGHLPGLLRRAVVTNPGIVGAYGHDGQIERARFLKCAERSSHGRIASEQQAVTPGFYGVAVVSAVGVAAQARPPVVHLERPNSKRACCGALTPTDLLNTPVAM